MRLLLAAIITFSTSAFACPNLAGKYATCRSTTGQTGGSTDVVVNQKIENGTTVYTIESTNDEQEREKNIFYADGKVYGGTYTDPETNQNFDIRVASQCEGNSLHTAMAIIHQNQAVFLSEAFASKTGNTLTQKITITTAQGKFEDTVICE